MTKTFFIFRHGETDWNKECRMQGGTDIPLNETGRAQALRLREYFKSSPVEAIISSDLSRAQETARIAKGDLDIPIHLEPRLRETNLGDAEGLTITEVESRFGSELLSSWRSLQPAMQNHRFPGGESKHEHLMRVLEALDEVVRVQPHKRLAISTHGGVMRRLIHHLRPELTEPAMVGNCVLYEITYDGQKGSWFIDLEPRC